MAVSKVAIKNVHLFDGFSFHSSSTVVIDGDRFGSPNDTTGAEIIDGQGGFLIPGLIDSHVHIRDTKTLESFAEWGVTAAVDCGCWPVDLMQSLREHSTKAGVPALRCAGIVATAPGSVHSTFPGLPPSALLAGAHQAEQFVENRVSEGVDLIKIVADFLGPNQDTVNALVAAARKRSKRSIIHASTSVAFNMALQARPDIITHAPMDEVLDLETVAVMAAARIVSIPTLTMEEALCNIKIRPNVDYSNARLSVERQFAAGIPIFAGTDSNDSPMARVTHGESIHRELELLVGAGLSPLEALRSATVEPAHYFDFDSGIIQMGRLANAVLLRSDPLVDIKATRNIRMVWCRGTRVF
ncbi:hydrolase [Penicillium atrosanguineum]|nr:hydrolase [Penicillium atrosanguineum]KAJ5137688.1 hydrolase [Penicillium atrosanguineum]